MCTADGWFLSVSLQRTQRVRNHVSIKHSTIRISATRPLPLQDLEIHIKKNKNKKPGPCSSEANSNSSMSSNFHQPSCLDNCLATFGNIIVPGDRDFDKVCKILSAKSADSTFSWLYCCDLNHCGIGFGSSAGLDCKPYSTSLAAQHWLTAPQANVNEVINTCKGSRILNKNKPVEGVSSLM